MVTWQVESTHYTNLKKINHQIFTKKNIFEREDSDYITENHIII